MFISKRRSSPARKASGLPHARKKIAHHRGMTTPVNKGTSSCDYVGSILLFPEPQVETNSNNNIAVSLKRAQSKQGRSTMEFPMIFRTIPRFLRKFQSSSKTQTSSTPLTAATTTLTQPSPTVSIRSANTTATTSTQIPTTADDTNPHLQRAEQLVAGLSVTTDDPLLCTNISVLFSFIHFFATDSKNKIAACAKAGALDHLLHISLFEDASLDARASSIRTLGQMCCFHEFISSQMAHKPNFEKLLVTVFERPIPRLWAESCYLMNVVAAECWSSHAVLMPFVPRCVALLNDTSNPDITVSTRANCIRFLGQLAANPANQERLVQERDVVARLVDAMKSLSVKQACTSAAVAVANLLGPHDDQQLLEPQHLQKLMSILIDALNRTLEGEDFPAGSNIYYDDWKLMVALSKLSAQKPNREFLRNLGLPQLIATGLSRNESNAKFVQHALTTLWLFAE